MSKDSGLKRSVVAGVALAAAVGVGLFVYTVAVRAPWFGASPVCLETWLNAATMLWAKNWRREGPFTLWFGYFWDPASIEFPTLASRGMYNSYPPGGALPVYLLYLFTGIEPSIAVVMGFALICQAVAVASLMALVFLFARKAGGSAFDAGCLACVPALVCLLLPAPAYLFQMAYIHIVVLPVFALFVLLEFLRDEHEPASAPRWLAVAQGVLAFYGTWCDWLFVFVLACVYMKRLARGQILRGGIRAALGRTIAFGLPPGTALGLFALILFHFQRFGSMADRFAERSMAGTGQFLAPTTKTLFWGFHIVRGYGAAGRVLILGSAAFLLIAVAYVALRRLGRKPPPPALSSAVSLMFMLVAPCMLHVLVFRQDSAHFFHYFTAAKFSVVLAAVPFVLAPLALLAAFGGGMEQAGPGCWWRRMTGRADVPAALQWSAAAPLLLALACAYTAAEARNTMKQFTALSKHDTSRDPAFLGANTAFEDVVFTPNSLLEIGPQPMGLAHSMKRVYVANSLKDIHEKTRDIAGDYVVAYFIRLNAEPNLEPDIRNLLAAAFDRRTDGRLVLYKVRKADFLRLCREMGLNPG